MDERLNILWLPAWFPSKVDRYPGDFIERHAKASSLLMNIIVLFVVKDTTAKHPGNKIEIEQTGNLIIYRGYYTGTPKHGLITKILSTIRYYKLLFKLYKQAKKTNGPFYLVHVHIALRQALLALYTKWKYKLPYVVTEHNGWFMPGYKLFFLQPFYTQQMVKLIYKKAAAVHTVSKSLGDELVKEKIIRSFVVIPNVVNTAVFNMDKTEHVDDFPGLNFIAVTGLTHIKNTDGVIRVFAVFIKKGFSATLHIAGPNIDLLKKLAQQLNIENNIKFYGFISNDEVAMLTKRCNAMIFFTRHETFGCVMAEALCCGIPVIASRIPVLEEGLTQNINALFVTSEDENDLLDKLIYFTQHRDLFISSSIAANAYEKYNYNTVAQQFKALYLSVKPL